MSGLSHSFSVEHAELYGVDCAVLIWHMQFWIDHNKKLKRNFFEGRTWMYQSQKDIAALYTYWSEDTVHRILKKLIKFGVLIRGSFNSCTYDKTAWFAFKDEEKFTIPRNRGIDTAETRNGNREIASPIPDTKTNTKEHIYNIARSDENSPHTDFANAKPIRAKIDISFDHEKKEFVGISEKDLSTWKYIYANIDISLELLKAIEWIKSNPSKSKKTNWRKFIVGWLQRAEDKAYNRSAFSNASRNPSEALNRDFAVSVMSKYREKLKWLKIEKNYVYVENTSKELKYANHDHKMFKELFYNLIGASKKVIQEIEASML